MERPNRLWELVSMVYHNDIPGWFQRVDFLAIEELAKTVPPNGLIVEIGSHMGKSTRAWLDNSDPSVRLLAIDPWEEWTYDDAVHRMHGDMSLLPMKVEDAFNDRLGVFRHFVPDTRVETLKTYSPPDAALIDSRGPIDLVFVDGGHFEEDVTRDLEFWWPRVSATGIMCGHDYNYVEVNRPVKAFAEKNGLEIIEFPYLSLIWVMKRRGQHDTVFAVNKDAVARYVFENYDLKADTVVVQETIDQQ